VSSNPTFSDFTGDPWSGYFYPYPTASMSRSGLIAGTNYYVRVRALDAYGNASNYVSPSSRVVSRSLAATPALDLDGVRLYPNPWRPDRHQGSPITFDQLTLNSTVKIFTVSGHLVETLEASSGSAQWNLTTDSGDTAASGLYLYLITNGQGQTSKGRFAIIR